MAKEIVRTPWGIAQEIIQISRYITLYHTAGHGGYKISDTYQKIIPESWRVEGGWYEEDCDSLIVEYFFYDLIKPKMDKAEIKEQAKEVLDITFPDEKTLEEKVAILDKLIHAEWGYMDEDDMNYLTLSEEHEYVYFNHFRSAYKKGKHWEEFDKYEFEIFYQKTIRIYALDS